MLPSNGQSLQHNCPGGLGSVAASVLTEAFIEELSEVAF